MDLKKAKLLLDKINALYQNMSADDHISAIERDLMKNYVQQLYAAFLDLPKGSAKAAPKVTLRKPAPKPTPKPTPKPVPPPPKVEVAPPPPPPVVKPTPPPPPPVVKAPKPTPPPVTISAEVEELFDAGPASNDLSERLSQAPIKDIKKAMGINERIFTMNELFGGDQGAFDDTLKQLNGFSSFAQARDMLATKVAGKFGWAEKSKKKKAQAFLKLVRRRYS